MNKIALFLGGALLGASTVVAAGAGAADEAIVLNVEQMDRITAGSVSLGDFPLALVQATANATGSYAHTATGVQSAVRKTESDSLPGVGDTYGTFTSGTAIAVGVNGSSTSRTTEVSTVNEQPFANVIGGAINVTMTGINTQISHASTAYYGGAWVTYYLNKMGP